MRAAVAGVLVVLGIAIGWGLYGNTSSPLNFTSDPGAKSDGIDARGAHPAEAAALAGRADRADRADEAEVRRHQRLPADRLPRLRLAGPARSPGRPPRSSTYTYRGGWGDPTTSAKSDDDRLVDLGKFDIKAVVGVLRGAPETLCIKPADVKSTYLSIDPSRDPTTPDAVSIDVYVSSDFGSGYIELAGDGSSSRSTTPAAAAADVRRRSAVRNPLLAPNISARYYCARCRIVVAAKQRR